MHQQLLKGGFPAGKRLKQRAFSSRWRGVCYPGLQPGTELPSEPQKYSRFFQVVRGLFDSCASVPKEESSASSWAHSLGAVTEAAGTDHFLVSLMQQGSPMSGWSGICGSQLLQATFGSSEWEVALLKLKIWVNSQIAPKANNKNYQMSPFTDEVVLFNTPLFPVKKFQEVL